MLLHELYDKKKQLWTPCTGKNVYSAKNGPLCAVAWSTGACYVTVSTGCLDELCVNTAIGSSGHSASVQSRAEEGRAADELASIFHEVKQRRGNGVFHSVFPQVRSFSTPCSILRPLSSEEKVYGLQRGMPVEVRLY